MRAGIVHDVVSLLRSAAHGPAGWLAGAGRLVGVGEITQTRGVYDQELGPVYAIICAMSREKIRWGASQNGGEFRTTSGENHWSPQPTTLVNPKSGMHPSGGVHPKMGVSFGLPLGRTTGLRSLLLWSTPNLGCAQSGKLLGSYWERRGKKGGSAAGLESCFPDRALSFVPLSPIYRFREIRLSDLVESSLEVRLRGAKIGLRRNGRTQRRVRR